MKYRATIIVSIKICTFEALPCTQHIQTIIFILFCEIRENLVSKPMSFGFLTTYTNQLSEFAFSMPDLPKLKGNKTNEMLKKNRIAFTNKTMKEKITIQRQHDSIQFHVNFLGRIILSAFSFIKFYVCMLLLLYCEQFFSSFILLHFFST